MTERFSPTTTTTTLRLECRSKADYDELEVELDIKSFNWRLNWIYSRLIGG